MAESHVISALIKKRGEVAGEIEYYEKIIKEYRENLISLDKTIHLFDENYNLDSIKPKRITKNKYFSNGEGVKMVLDALRDANKPLATDEILDIVAGKKSLVLNDKARATFQKSILFALNSCQKNDLVVRLGKEGATIIWQIKKVA